MSRDHNPAPRVSIQPTSFNESSTLGRVAQIAYNPTNEQLALGIKAEQNVVFWQGRKTEAQAMTVDIGTVALPPPQRVLGGQPWARPFAAIQYGVDGNIQNTVYIDLGTGRRVTLVANYISVNVGMDPPEPSVTSPSAVLSYGASIGTFAAPSVAPLVRSVYVEFITPANTLTDFLPIPLRASVLLVPTPANAFGSAAFVGIVTALFSDIQGRTVGTWLWNYTTGLGFIPIPVPADAFFVRIESTVDNTYMRLPFQLSL